MGLADFAGGVQEALAEIIRDRLEREETERRMAQQQFQNERVLKAEGLDERRFGEGVRQFDASLGVDQDRLGLARDQFGFEQQQWGDMAPQRTANVGLTTAQTDDIVRRPDAEAADRAHDVSMENLRGTWGLRTIGAQGAEQRRTASANRPAAGPADAGQSYADERGNRIVDDIDALSARVGPNTAGFIGALGKWIPGTAAHDFAADLETLAANISFKELQEMRNASKTGGALGQVAVRELELLESTLGSLRQSQSPEQLRGNMAKARQAIIDSQQRWQQAKGGGGGRASGPGPGAAPARPSAADLIRRYGGG